MINTLIDKNFRMSLLYLSLCFWSFGILTSHDMWYRRIFVKRKYCAMFGFTHRRMKIMNKLKWRELLIIAYKSLYMSFSFHLACHVVGYDRNNSDWVPVQRRLDQCDRQPSRPCVYQDGWKRNVRQIQFSRGTNGLPQGYDTAHERYESCRYVVSGAW